MLLSQLGLKKDDILLSLNDTSVNDLKNLPSLLETLSKAKQFDLVLERQGEVQTLNIYLEL
jgi:type II secretory pathway component PulC